jgi:predicted flap endonuclease-1-like 5' DNA nuclease
MIFLLQHLAPWTLAAAALGLVFGLLAGGGTRRPGGAFFALVLLLAAGAAADALGLAPGRYGLWLEIGLAIFGACALGHGLARLILFLLSPSARTAPDWLGAARETLAQAEAFVAAAPAALAANEAAAALAAMAAPAPQEAAPPRAARPETAPGEAASPAPEAPPPSLAAEPAEDGPAPEAAEALAAIVGLDSRSARELRAQGVNDLDSLAGLTAEGRRAAAERLGLDEATIEFWSAQARLYAHGVARPPSGARDETGIDTAPAPAVRVHLPRVDAGRLLDALYPGERPPGSPLAPESGADDLTRIAGVDAAVASRLHGLGIWTFAQIAGWTPDQARWIEFYLAQPGRAGREHWREQAARLAGGAQVAP